MVFFVKLFLNCLLLFLFVTFFSSSVFAQAVINEFSVNPPDKQDWIEIYSPTTIDISNWSVRDEAGEIEKIPEGVTLGPGIYYVIPKYQRLNNDKDTIYLYDSEGSEKDSIKYGYEGEVCVPEPEGSIARIPDGSNTYDRLLIHTKEQTNGEVVTSPCPIPTPTPINTPTPTPKPTSTPTPSNIPPTSTPTPIALAVIVKTPTSTKKSINTPTPISKPSTLGETTGSADVLSAVDLAPETESTPTGNGSMKVFIVSLLLIGLGLALLSILFIWKKRKAMMLKEEHEL